MTLLTFFSCFNPVRYSLIIKEKWILSAVLTLRSKMLRGAREKCPLLLQRNTTNVCHRQLFVLSLPAKQEPQQTTCQFTTGSLVSTKSAASQSVLSSCGPACVAPVRNYAMDPNARRPIAETSGVYQPYLHELYPLTFREKMSAKFIYRAEFPPLVCFSLCSLSFVLLLFQVLFYHCQQLVAVAWKIFSLGKTVILVV